VSGGDPPTGAPAVAARGACLTLTCFSADATTIFGVVRCADCFTCASAAKAETVKRAALANTILRARMAISPSTAAVIEPSPVLAPAGVVEASAVTDNCQAAS